MADLRMNTGEWKTGPLASTPVSRAALVRHATNICNGAMTSSWREPRMIGKWRQLLPVPAHISKQDAKPAREPSGAYLGLWQGEASAPQAVAFPSAKALSTPRACDDLHLVHGCIAALGAEHPAHLLCSRNKSRLDRWLLTAGLCNQLGRLVWRWIGEGRVLW